MTTFNRAAKDDLERMVINNVAESGGHAVNAVEGDVHFPWASAIEVQITEPHVHL